jgi:hypothetical protein
MIGSRRWSRESDLKKVILDSTRFRKLMNPFAAFFALSDGKSTFCELQKAIWSF